VSVREPAVEGVFYPADPAQLSEMIAGFLSPGEGQDRRMPKALIVPHAGLIYSGPVAGKAYSQLRPFTHLIRKVVLLGPSHRVAFEGLAIPRNSEFRTALGSVLISQELKKQVMGLPQIIEHDAPHEQEHSLEVQLPFLQVCLEHFELLPVVVGDATSSAVSELLDLTWGGPETLIVASSDLSHYLDYDSAKAKDGHTSMRILNREYTLHGDEACGCRVLNGLLKQAVSRDVGVEQLLVANSGDTAGDKRRVVGYGAYVLH